MKKISLKNTGLILLAALFVLFVNNVSAQEKTDSSKMHHVEHMKKNMKDMPDSCKMMMEGMKDMPDSCKMMMEGMKDMPDSCKMMMEGMKEMPDSCKMMKEHEQGEEGHMKGHKMMGDKKMKEHMKIDMDMKGVDMKGVDMKGMDMKGMDSHESIVRKGEIDLSQIDKNKDGKVFQDQMDWNVISDEAGRCPVCEMKLKEVTIDDAKKNLIENGFKIKE